MSKGVPVNPGCELVDRFCGDECHCFMQAECATHGEEWPCEPQKEYEATAEVQLILAKDELTHQRELLGVQGAALDKLTRDHNRLVRIVEQALIPFMRDAMPQIGGQLQISWGCGDSESLLGCDLDGDKITKITFNRGRSQGTDHGITYWASNGTRWTNGTRVPTKPNATKSGRMAAAMIDDAMREGD